MLTKIEKDFAIGGDLHVSRIGFGAMRLTGKGIWGQPEDKAQALQVLKCAIDLGVNFIDTADSYGPDVSEQLIAEALYPYPRDLVIGTKGGLLRSGPNIWTPDASPKHLKEALDGSLKKLRVDRIDLYQLHRIDPKVPAAETFAFLKQAQAEGKIKHIGLSEVNVQEIKHAEQFFRVVSVQNMYSVDNRKWENVLKYCEDNGIAFIPWYPLNAGAVEKSKILHEIAQARSSTIHQVALSWLLHKSNNILLIPGTSSVQHLEENMKSASLILNDSDLQALEKL
ncbi:MAG: aldo/keto reductase [Leptospirales bacterium]|nr:aldo/keto reductase [Leptospirales bacterium]